jgi:hypothetical protein
LHPGENTANEIVGAVVLAEPASLRSVAGMPVLVRLLRSFEKTSVGPVAVAAGGELSDPVKTLLSSWGLEQVVVTTDEVEALRNVSGVQSDGVVALVRGGAAVDPVFLEDLASELRSGKLEVPVKVGGELALRRADGSGSFSSPAAELDTGRFAGTLGPVRTRGEAYVSKRALIRACRKPMEIDGVVCTLLGRPLSGWISHVLLELPITPNDVTAASLVLGLAAGAVAAVGSYGASVVGAAVLFLSWVLDNCDGEIARVKHQGSTWGAWFDIYADFATNLAFVAGMAIGSYRSQNHWAYLGAGALTVFGMTFYNGAVFRHIHRLGVPDEFLCQWWFDRETSGSNQPRPDAARSGFTFSAVFSVLKYMGRRDFFIFTYLVSAIAGVLHWAFWATCVGATFSLLLTVIHLFVTWRRAPHG